MAGGTANEALKDRVSRLENFVGVLEDDSVVPLSVSTEQHAIELVDLRKILDDFITEMSARISNIMRMWCSMIDIVKINLKCLEDDVALIKNRGGLVDFKVVGSTSSTEKKKNNGGKKAKDWTNQRC
ncbi:hypothetical protein F0562_008095 [Nyssa sinensis]|uniref:Uncharacterized protein n=1 Tax=Nyssa sinensis TaxID=561372 RepID=A0A5J5A8P6_9ASTE|nr:hypothetical protein F0562_008095 [Nyssa sinensis]